jgi:hypothetical protein
MGFIFSVATAFVDRCAPGTTDMGISERLAGRAATAADR